MIKLRYINGRSSVKDTSLTFAFITLPAPPELLPPGTMRLVPGDPGILDFEIS